MKNDIKSPILQNLISYPWYNEGQYQERVKELQSLGVEEIILTGPTTIFNLNVLGKGHSGIVVKVNTNKGKNLALKIRRLDSRRKNLNNEAKFMVIANSLNIGPKLIDSKKNCILMEFIEGQKISTWLEYHAHMKTPGNKETTKKALNNLMEQCYLLDRMYLDHGELTRIDNHVIVSDNRVSILDFESSSVNRKTANVTSIIQSLFFSGIISKRVKDIMDFSNSSSNLLRILRKYKNEQNKENFERIVSSIWDYGS